MCENKINNTLHKPVDSPINNNRHAVIAKGDSAATHNYWKEEDKHCLTSMQPEASCNVALSNAEAITPSQRGRLPLSTKLSKAAKDDIALPQFKSSSLISLGQLCDDDCCVLSNKKNLKLIKNNEILGRHALVVNVGASKHYRWFDSR